MNETQVACSKSVDAGAGQRMYEFIRKLYPLCRSITGDGLRASLAQIQELIPITLQEVPTGTRVFDWTIPREWNIRDAYVKDGTGRRIIDFRECNLHVMNYSVPVRRTMPLEELKKHLFTLPDRPDWIPYRTSYYNEHWGFCLSHRQMLELPEGSYEVCIDSSLADGSLTYGEFYLPGDSPEEVLFSCHCCHPSLCNDNLSGMAVATFLAQHLRTMNRRYSYRFLFIPGTVGSIAWLARNESVTPRIKHGLVLSCLGDSGVFSYKKSRRGDAEIDRAVTHILAHSQKEAKISPFIPYGYDERQYCSPGFNLAVGRLSRSSNGCYAEYHTSADNLDFVRPQYLAESLEKLLEIVRLLESNRSYLNLNPKCEPQLGKRGLYRALGGLPDAGARELALLWVLNMSDGQHSLLDIAELSQVPFAIVNDAAEALQNSGLLDEVTRRDVKSEGKP
jgi:aminopeptidase-like protein